MVTGARELALAGRRLRVCMVTTTLPLGGAESLQLEVLSRLDPVRFTAEVICLRDAGQMAARFRSAGIAVTVMGRRRAQHLLTPLILAAELRRRRVDIVLVTPHHAALYIAPAAARLAGVKGTVLGLHQIGGKRIGIPSLPPRGVELMWLIDALVLLTAAQRDYLVAEEGLGRFPWRRVRHATIPNGIVVRPPPDASAAARARASLGLPDGDVVLGMVAALRPEKNHELLLRAAARLLPGRPNMRVALVGSGAREPILRQLAGDLGIAPRVGFHGFRDDVADLLPALDVVCLTSDQETFPISVLEAMAAARPVVMTDPAGVPPIVIEGVTGHLVPVGDEDALVDSLGRLLDDPALRARMGARGRERAVRHFPLTQTVRRYEELFIRLARHAGAGGP